MPEPTKKKPTMEAPQSGVKIRMYRQGHGDCFLLAMPSDTGDRPFFLLIDCGLKPGSEMKVKIEEVIADIAGATGGHIDAVLITHEHQDHTNMFLARLNRKQLFDDITFGEVLLGWTANPEDPEAQQLRQVKLKALMRLLAARRRLAGLADEGEDVKQTLDFVDAMLAFEGVEDDFWEDMKKSTGGPFGLAKSDAVVAGLSVAKSMDYVVGKGRPRYFSPHEEPFFLPGVSGVALYPLGPPRDDRLNEDEPDKGDSAGQARMYERTKHSHGLGFGFGGGLEGMFAGADAELLDEDGESFEPFASRLKLVKGQAGWTKEIDGFFAQFSAADDPENWQRINLEWLSASAWFADKINTELNNSSLVVAIELVKSRKVLLFPGDAQYGSWMSWASAAFNIPAKGATPARSVTTQDLLARTVFYKVGHHGSHNATLKGQADSDYANLDWMGLGSFAEEFVAVIPANTNWAMTENSPAWEHPLEAILKALEKKTSGRLFKSDTDFDEERPKDTPAADWNDFMKRVKSTDMYFEYTVLDQ